MATLTIRLPDDKHERPKALAKARSISVNKLMAKLWGWRGRLPLPTDRHAMPAARHAVRAALAGPGLGTVVALALACALAGCGKRSAAKLDAPMIEALARAGAQAAAARDAQTLCAQVAESAEIKMVMVRFSGSEVLTLDKPQYCKLGEAVYASLPAGLNIRSAVDVQSLDIAADGQSAEVTAQVSEDYELGPANLRQPA